MLTPEAIAELKGLAAKATPGPWDFSSNGCWIRVFDPIDGPIAICYGLGLNELADNNLQLIVALRNSLSGLLLAAEAVAVMKGALETLAVKEDYGEAFDDDGDLIFVNNYNYRSVAQEALSKIAAMKEQA